MPEIHVLLIKPYRYPERITIQPGLESLQKQVGGGIEAIYPFEDPVAIICNEEGKLQNMPLNRALYDKSGDMCGLIAGNFLVVGLGDEDFTSLSDEMMRKYEERFHYPEDFLEIGGQLIVIRDDMGVR